jgi:hypothetical protein
MSPCALVGYTSALVVALLGDHLHSNWRGTPFAAMSSGFSCSSWWCATFLLLLLSSLPSLIGMTRTCWRHTGSLAHYLVFPLFMLLEHLCFTVLSSCTQLDKRGQACCMRAVPTQACMYSTSFSGLDEFQVCVCVFQSNERSVSHVYCASCCST